MKHTFCSAHPLASDVNIKKEIPLPSFGKRRLAAPSWVMAGTIKENCAFLAGKVHEVGLLFFETKSSLAYTHDDLPHELSMLPLSFHVHLPSDLQKKNGREDALLCCELMDKVSFLSAKKAVLHVPAENPELYLESFVQQWESTGRCPTDLLLENTEEQSLLSLHDLITAMNLSVCIDTGHALAYGQEELFFCQKLLERTQMIHFNAPGKGALLSSHLPLTTIETSTYPLFENLLAEVSEQAICMLELFQWEKIEASLPILLQWITKKNIGAIKR